MRLSALCFIVAIGICTASTAQVPQYSVVDLGDWNHIAQGTSPTGAVLGINNFGTNDLPERWDGSWSELEILPDHFHGAVFQESAGGGAVGFSSPGTGSFPTAVQWVNGELQSLNLGAGVGASAYSISSDSGHIAGNVVFGFGVFEGFVVDAAGNVTLTATLPGHNVSSQRDVNNLGHAVGDSRFAGLVTERGTFYSPQSGLVDLGVLPNSNHLRSTAKALNDSDTVVGWSWRSFPSSDSVAFIWNNKSGMMAIGDSPFSQANDINNGGWIVGRHGTDEAFSTAFIYRDDTGVIELNSLLVSNTGWNLLQAIAINNNGQIVGFGRDPQNELHSYLLNPVTTDVVVVADSFLVTRGTYVSGSVVELAASDNADLSLQRATAEIQSRTEFEVKAISPLASPSSLEVTLEGSVFARSQVNQTTELFDYVAGVWEQVDTRAATRFTDSTVTVAVTGDLSRFVEAGTMCMTARIRYQSPVGRQQFSSNTDQFIWTIGQ